MKKTLLRFFEIFLLLITFTSLGQVTNTISELKINNNVVSQINFASNPIINVAIKVKLQTFNGASDNILGNLFIYTKKNSTDGEIQRDFSSVTFTVTNPPFVSQTTYDSEISFIVPLTLSQFNSTGGILYAEYKNNNGQKFKSSNVNIVNTLTPTNPVPNSYHNIESIKYADTGYSTEGEMVLIHKGQPGVSLDMSYAVWHSQGISLCGGKFVYVRRKYNNGLVSLLNNGTLTSYPSTPCQYSYDTIRGNLPTFNIPTTQVNNKEFISVHFTPKNSASGVRGPRVADLFFRIVEFTGTNIFALRSSRSEDSYVTSIASNMARIKLSATIKQDYSVLEEETLNLQQFEWYKRPLNGTWTLTNQPEYADLKALTVTTEFFKRSIYKGVFKDSNIVTVEPHPAPSDPQLPGPDITNTICCNQQVIIGASPSSIVGNTIAPTRSLQASYQWQNSFDGVFWTDIDGATWKDFTPQPLSSRSTFAYYRRVVKTLLGNSYSNYVSLMAIQAAGGKSAKDSLDYSINIYPNPSSDILNIESANDISGSAISVYDSHGNKKNITTPYSTENNINFNISDLPQGLYLLIIESVNETITRQFIKK